MSSTCMKLSAFKVTNFRSVRDSGWIDVDDVTALIGTNESGKTNLLLPLWKLNPAKEGEIKLLADAPRKEFNTYRSLAKKPVFITARFVLPDDLAQDISEKTRVPEDKVRCVEVSRDLGGEYAYNFPQANPAGFVDKDTVEGPLAAACSDIEGMAKVDDADGDLKSTLVALLGEVVTGLGPQTEKLTPTNVAAIEKALSEVDLSKASPQSTIAPRFRQVAATVAAIAKRLGTPGPNDLPEVRKLVRDRLPVFVYYSTYGNLDSEIYLPHVIEDLKRQDLTGKAEARARTLRVLFSFVKLKPEEILELGKDWIEKAKPSEEQIQALNEKKKERSVLLQSAGTDLTEKFREWWKQGEYRMRFEADGNHFRIWVSDDKRPEEIELELRSTGLQWFISFYLIFLVESEAAHNGAILLLDEPGHSLHPIAQRDLSVFFENLSQSNQLLYTTHSPFLVDADHLDRVRSVFVDDHGHTAVSTNLRAGQAAQQSKSVYPVHAALGLSVSETLFQGCRPTIVEGPSDQIYLSAIKTLLVGLGKLQPTRELVFVPSSGAKAIKTVAAILGGRDDDLPLVLCDSDDAGKRLAASLRGELYKAFEDRILLVADFVGRDGAQIEDLFPASFMAQAIDRFLRGPVDDPFRVEETQSVVEAVKAYASKHKLALADGWKVDLARAVKARLTTEMAESAEWAGTVSTWERLFSRLAQGNDESLGDAAKGAKAVAGVTPRGAGRNVKSATGPTPTAN